MKKLLVVLLALTFVIVLSTAAFAVATASVDGKVEVTLTSGDQFGQAVDGKIDFDLAKDFGEGYKAGLKIRINPAENTSGWVLVQADTAPDGALTIGNPPVPYVVVIDGKNYYYVKVDVDKNSSVAFEGAGFIEMTKDWGVLTLKTDINANVGNDLSGFCDLTSGPGMQVVYTGIEGLTLTGVINDAANLYNYNLKAVYATDALTAGFAYQSNTVVEGADPAANDAMGVWGSYKIGDAITVGAEFVSRPNVIVDGATSILVKGSYVADALTVNGSVTIKTMGFLVKDPTKYAADADKYSIAEVFDYSNVFDATLIKVDASYKITEALGVNGNFQMMTGEVMGFEIEENNMSYKVGATYTVSEQLGTEAWYKAIGTEDVNSQIGVKATYTFVAGLVGSLEMTSTTTAGVDEAANAYTAKVTATL